MPSPLPLKATRTPYLFLRGRWFYFRVMLPPRGRSTTRNSLCISLRTTEHRTAKLRMFKLETAMAKLIEDAHLSNPDVMAVLRRIAREHFEAIMGEHNRHYAFSDDTQHAYNMEAVQQAFTQKQEIVKRKASLTLEEADMLYDLTTPYLEPTDPPADHAMLSHLDWLLKRASLEATRIYLAKCNGDFGNAVVRDEVFTGVAYFLKTS